LTFSASSQLSCLGHEEFCHQTLLQLWMARKRRKKHCPESLNKSSNLNLRKLSDQYLQTLPQQSATSIPVTTFFFKILKLQSVWSTYGSNFRRKKMRKLLFKQSIITSTSEKQR
jgi:hypothetical protein